MSFFENAPIHSSKVYESVREVHNFTPLRLSGLFRSTVLKNIQFREMNPEDKETGAQCSDDIT